TDALALTGADATVAAVSAAMDGAALVHVAAHGRLRSDNPLFSSLLMVDGPLTVYDLERLGRPPHHVVLAACEAALPHVISIDEVLGLAAALLAQGTTSLIAPVISVVDQETVPLMLNYHAKIRAGRSAAEALAIVQTEAAAHGHAYWASAAAFVCMGAGHRPDLLQRRVRTAGPTIHRHDHVSVIHQLGL
ncbi:MAG TPA: CHAT domain-containing protein, partial [Acidimicrobiales bacterium]|nr:CHAT domain-containing protein [Acidimicrobiales bacterium]